MFSYSVVLVLLFRSPVTYGVLLETILKLGGKCNLHHVMELINTGLYILFMMLLYCSRLSYVR